MAKSTLSSGKKAKKTGQWAKTMTKWLITYSTKGKKHWQIVSFEGPRGGESTGIVDRLAIRKNHKLSTKSLKRGDLFEIVLIQVKGGVSKWPTEDEIHRLLKVAEFYHAKDIILAVWKKGKVPTLYRLKNTAWKETDAKTIFGR